MTTARRPATGRGFTIIELLVVMGIIVLLVSILLPVIGQVRIRAYAASTQGEMSRISNACQNYFHDWNSYPGPLSNVQLSNPRANTTPIQGVTGNITSSENLVLGLLGYLSPPTQPGKGPTFTFPGVAIPPGHDVLSLNPLHPGSFHYIDFVASELSPGMVSQLEYAHGQTAGDSNVPEFIDTIPLPMPILYIRAAAGNPVYDSNKNAVASMDDTTTQYNYTQLAFYGCTLRTVNNNGGTAGAWMKFDSTLMQALNTDYKNSSLASDVTPPFNQVLGIANAPSGTPAGYFANPNIASTPRGKDTFILISAGVDRTYGTQDDLIVTP